MFLQLRRTGVGPPCQDVSGLNADRRGSQRGLRSALYKEIPRVKELLVRAFPWAQVWVFVESVASMDVSDRAAMSQDLGMTPYQVDSAGVSLARRPRLYWFGWELTTEPGLTVLEVYGTAWETVTPVELVAEFEPKDFLEAGWTMPPGHRFPILSQLHGPPIDQAVGRRGCPAAMKPRWPDGKKTNTDFRHTNTDQSTACITVMDRCVLLALWSAKPSLGSRPTTQSIVSRKPTGREKHGLICGRLCWETPGLSPWSHVS